ncbi:MAG: SDR family oxidoreductase, partial [Myxococcota bacterium]
MNGVCIVQGASRGIGLEFVRQLAARGERVIATCRSPGRADALQALAAANHVRVLALDLEDERPIEAAAAEVDGEISLLINAAGLLHDGELQPEKKLAHVDPASLQRVFAVNAYGPLLMAKHFASKLPRRERAVFASLSARVGSIGDNRLGGWYAYRASKAAQNMFTKNLAIELGRRHKGLAVIALHPGTVRTDLSAPFRSNVPE